MPIQASLPSRLPVPPLKLRRVVVTGFGIVSPVGSRPETAWTNVRDGVSGISAVEDFDASTFATRIAGQLKDFDAEKYLSRKDQRKGGPFIHYGVGAAFEALDSSPTALKTLIRIAG